MFAQRRDGGWYKKILILKPAMRLILKDINFVCHSYKKILILKPAIRLILKDINFVCHSYEKILIFNVTVTKDTNFETCNKANTKRY